MKNRLKLLGILAAIFAISFLVIFPAGRDPDAIRRINDYQILGILSEALHEYVKQNGHYPKDLSVFSDLGVYEKKEKFLPFIDPFQTLYMNPDTPTPQGNFILLVRPFKNGVTVVFANGTIQSFKIGSQPIDWHHEKK